MREQKRSFYFYNHRSAHRYSMNELHHVRERAAHSLVTGYTTCFEGWFLIKLAMVIWMAVVLLFRSECISRVTAGWHMGDRRGYLSSSSSVCFWIWVWVWVWVVVDWLIASVSPNVVDLFSEKT